MYRERYLKWNDLREKCECVCDVKLLCGSFELWIYGWQWHVSQPHTISIPLRIKFTTVRCWSRMWDLERLFHNRLTYNLRRKVIENSCWELDKLTINRIFLDDFYGNRQQRLHGIGRHLLFQTMKSTFYSRCSRKTSVLYDASYMFMCRTWTHSDG